MQTLRYKGSILQPLAVLLRHFIGVKALPYEGVKVYKATVAFVSTVRRFYDVEAHNFEGPYDSMDQQRKGSLAWRNLKWRFMCRLYGKKRAL